MGRDNPVLRILERLPLSAVVASPFTGRILWVNARNMEVAGATDPAQLVGRNILDFLEPGQHAIALRDLAAVAVGMSPPPVIYRLKRLDGAIAEVHIASVPMPYEGKPAMLSIVSDVSEYSRAHREFAESEGRFRELIESLADGLLVVVDREVVYANPAAGRLFGSAPDASLAGADLYALIDESCHSEMRAARKRVALSRAPQALPLRCTIVCADGSRLDVMTQTTLVRWQGQTATQLLLSGI